ncbi:MAG: DegT/DnrJ/EryC1/StrS family aminotransferase [Nanoarchaeota archaeon]|nr:DegT/DnrJ/EryC1/StrS family aminotransferase [Nanoarchaeota archaeon]
MVEFKIGVGTLNLSERCKRYVNQVLDSNRLSYGPFLKKFENEFARIHDSKYAVFTNSGTSSLHIAVACLKERYGWQDGDEVIVPAVTFIASSNVLIHNGLVPVFADVEKDYYGIDPSLIEDKITRKTRAIMPVHLFGLPCDMGSIMKIAQKYGLKVIEDSCETMFAKYNGRSVGSFGDISCFSTYVAHLLVTGVGGLTVTNDPENAVILRSLANHGRDNIYIHIDDDKDKSREELKEIIDRRFSFVRMGHSLRGTEMEGAIGLGQLEEHEEMMRKRRQVASKLLDGLKDIRQIQLPKIREDCDHSFMMFPVVLHNESKERFVNYLESKGIETRDMLPLVNQPVYKKFFGLRENMFPIADWINKNGFYIGCHQDISEEEIQHIIKVFHEFFSFGGQIR